MYGGDLSDSGSENSSKGGDKLITIRYSTYSEEHGDNTEDSVTFEAGYDSKSKKILNMSVHQGPCLSDMCGP